ncbi:hypothetical protein LSH36_58g20008, partial [Paralvinella palmiformis]
NGLSVSSGSRYKGDSSLERNYHDYSSQDIQKEQFSSPNRHLNLSVNGTSNHTMNSFNHRLGSSHLMTDVDHCSTGRSQSMTRLNMLSSQDWKSPSCGSPSRCSTKARTGAALQDTNRSPLGRESENMHQALEESEDRRHLLVDRLRDAQETIKFQSQRIAEIENSARDTSVSVDELRFKEKELIKRINSLEREKNSYYEKNMESMKAREQLQHRNLSVLLVAISIESLSMEVASLRTTMELVQCDLTKKDKTITHLTSCVNELEECNEKLSKNKDALLKELDSVRQSLDLCRSHSEYLEGQDKEYRGDIDKLREENQVLIIEKRSFSQKTAALETKNYSMNEDNKTLSHNLQKLTDEKQQLHRQLNVLQETIADLKSTLAVTIADKERFFQQKMEFSNQLQKSSFEKESWEKLRCSLEEQVSELTGELTRMRQDTDNYSDERQRNKSLEQTKMMALKQHELYEQEILSLEAQLKQHKESLSSLKMDHQREKESMEQFNMKSKDEVRELRSERNQFEIRCHEAEAKLRQSEQNLSVYSNDQQRELQNWKSQCEKLTASNSRKDMEIEVFNRRVQDLENQTQFEELTEARSELKRLQEENRCLLQERAENEQVIQLLEMQKDVLAKTNEGSMNKVKDVEQLQYTVEQLTVEKQELQDELTTLESRESERKKQESLSGGRDGSGDLPEPIRLQISELEVQNNQLKEIYSNVSEKLAAAEQISLQTKYRDCVSRSEYNSLERNCEELKRTAAQLEEQVSMTKHQNEQLTENNNRKTVESQDMWVIHKQKEDLANQVNMLSGQISICQEDNSQVASLEKQVKQLTGDLENTKRLQANQDNLIESLKEELEEEKTKKPSKLTQSLDAVGEDLTAVRTELHKLGDIIQGKDIQIEELEKQLVHFRKQLTDK